MTRRLRRKRLIDCPDCGFPRLEGDDCTYCPLLDKWSKRG